MKDYDRLHPHTYQPTFEDAINTRRKTTGIFEYSSRGTIKAKIIDSGGQRNERKKWAYKLDDGISYFSFVVPLSEFDQLCYEDDVTNRSLESLQLFEDTCPKLVKGNTIVIFTKIDLLTKKLKDNSKFKIFQEAFPSYKKGNNVEDVIAFFKELYYNIYSKFTTNSLEIFTCNAVDSESTESLFNEIFKI